MVCRPRLPFAALLLVPSSANAAPMQPTGKWHLFYQESLCLAERPFGDHVLSLQPSPLGKTTRLVILAPGRITRTRQLDSLIELADGEAPIKTSSLVYGTSQKGMRGITTILPAADAERLSRSNWLRISTLGTAPKSRRTTPTSEPVFQAEMALGSTAALSRELSKCLADLQAHWGMVNGELPAPVTPAQFSIKGVFHSDDYPEEAIIGDQDGTSNYMLMIDEKGSLIDCVITHTSGVASLDAMGCQVMKERVKAKPALDASGKPVKSLFRQSVSWRIAG